MVRSNGRLNVRNTFPLLIAATFAAPLLGCENEPAATSQNDKVVFESELFIDGLTAQPTPVMTPLGDAYEDVEPNPVVAVVEEPVSTFSIDVDTVAYANVRRFLNEGALPPRDAVRVEEMINYFDYAYDPPLDASEPFSATTTVVPTPWNDDTQLVHIAIKGYDIVDTERRPRANLVFLVDVSGSMQGPDRLPLLVQSLRLLVNALQPDDSVAIVTYAGSVGVALEPTPIADKEKILAALDLLGAGGSTAGAAGIALAYDTARAGFIDDGVNRVILATDGDFNVGISDTDQLQDLIERERKSGVYLSVLGFGRGNLNDQMMQRIAQHGNGNAAYIDSLMEAKKALVDELDGTLFPIANDVKIQVEFNPAQVAEYRLLGYETRLLDREDFNNDKVDAGEIGNGHAVTAIYEIVPTASPFRWVDPLRYSADAAVEDDGGFGSELAYLKIRYKLPGETTSTLMQQPILAPDNDIRLTEASEDVRFAVAVAAYGELLRDNVHLGTWEMGDVIDLASNALGDDPFGYRREFVRLADLAGSLRATQ
ncbi:MAG: VWA domain-containing protein [Pseudomonadota bacterium]